MDISWTLLFTLCLYGNLVTARKKHKRSLHSTHDDDSAVKLKKTKQFVFQAMLKRPTKTKRHIDSELSADPILSKKVIRNFNADFFSDKDLPGASADAKSSQSSQKSRRQLSPAINRVHNIEHRQSRIGKSKRHANSMFKVNVIAKPAGSPSIFKRETKIKRNVPLSRGIVTKVRWYPAVKSKRHAIPSPSAAHMFGDKRNYIKLQVSVPKKHKRSISVHEDDNTELRRTKRNLYRALLQRRRIGKRQVPTNFNVDMMGMPRSPIARPMVKGQVQVVNFQIKVAHDWRDEMYNASSPEFELLVGNLVDAFANELTADYNFHSSAVTKLRKSDRAHWVLVDVATRFYKTESNPLHHLQGIVSKGWVSGQRVDPEYFILLGVLNGNKDIQKIKFPQKLKLRLVPPHIETSTTPPPEPEQEKVQKKLKFKEIRISIKLKQMYGMFLSDRKSPEFKELGGNLEQAVYKIFSRDSFFLGTKTLGFRESPEGRCIAVIAIDFKNEEKYAIEKMQAMISGGDLAGMPVDDTYLIVNSLSEVRLNGTVNKGNKPPQTNPLVHHTNTAENKDVSTSVPQTSSYSYQAKTVTPANTITTAPPSARSNVTVSEAKLSQKAAEVEAPINANQTAQQSPPELPQIGKAPVVKVVDVGALAPQNATNEVPSPEAGKQVQEVTNVESAPVVAPTFKPGVEGQAVVPSSNATAPDEIKYLVTSPGVVVAEFPLHNESVAIAPPSPVGIVEEKVDEATPQSVPVKLIKGAKIVNETSEPNVVQVPLIPLATLTGNPPGMNASAPADIAANASQFVQDAANYLPAITSQNITNPIGTLLNTTTGQTYVPNIPPVIPIQPVAPVSNQAESTEATSKLSVNLAPPLAALAPLANLTTYPGLLPAATVPLQAAPMANLTIPVNVNIIPNIPPPNNLNITAHLLSPAEAVPLVNTTDAVPVVTINATLPADSSEAANTSNAVLPLANVSQPIDIAIVKAQEQPMNSDVENSANAPAQQTPALFPQPMDSKVAEKAMDGTAVLENSSPAATLLPASNAVTLPVTASENPVTASPNAPFKKPTVNQIIGSLINSSVGVPAQNEAPVTSNVISVPENVQAITPAAPVANATTAESVESPTNATTEPEAVNAPVTQAAEPAPASLENANAPVIPATEAAPALPANSTAAEPITPAVTAEAAAPANLSTSAPINIPASVAAVKTPAPAASVENATTSQPINAPLALEYAVPVPYRRPSVNDIIASLNGSTTTTSPPPERANETVPITEATPTQQSNAQVVANIALPKLEEAVATNISALAGMTISNESVSEVITTPPPTPSLPPNPSVTEITNQPLLEKSVSAPLTYKSVLFAIRVIAPWSDQLAINDSVPYVELSALIEQEIDNVLTPLDPFYVDVGVQEFLKDPEGVTIAHIMARFLPEELHPVDVTRNACVQSNFTQVTLDKDFFFVLSADKDISPEAMRNETLQNAATYLARKQKPKPLIFKEIRFSIRLIEPWNSSYENNNTMAYAVFSGMVEQAVDRALMGDSNYIDSTTLEMEKDQNNNTIVFVAVRFRIQEQDLEKKIVSVVQNGSLSGLPIDKNFFEVFSLSETHHPAKGVLMKPPDEIPLLSLAEELIAGATGVGQKQSATNDSQSQQPAPPTAPPATIPIALNVTIAITDQPLFTSGEDGHALDDDVIPTATAPPNKVQSVASERVVTMAPSMHVMATKTEGPPVVTDSTDALPTETPYVTTPLPQGSSSNIATEMPGGTPLEHIEGSMTLQQNWHPFLADKKSNEYKLLEETVISEIKNLYLHTVNEEVIPQVIGFTETATPPSSTHNSNDTEISVSFKVMFLPRHESNAGPLEQAVKSNSLGDLVLYPTSLVLQRPNSSSPSLPIAVTYTSCQSLHMTAVSAADGQIGGFIPECTPDGAFKPVQCHALTGFCWCVNHIGVRIVGTEERYKEPSCEGIILKGKVILPKTSPPKLAAGSCISVSVQEFLLCGGDVNCHIPILGNKTFRNVRMINGTIEYSMPLMQLKPGSYVLSAVVNVGWCRINSVLSKDLIHQGDYHTTILHDIVVTPETKVIHKDIKVDLLLPEETGINLSGDIVLPPSTPSPLPPGSCLVIQTKSWNPAFPIIGNMTVMEPDIVNNTMSYEMHIPDLDPGTYVLRCILHMYKCDLADDSPKGGDFYQEKKYEVGPDTTDVEEDLNLVEQLPDTHDVTLRGKILLPPAMNRYPTKASCLILQVKDYNPNDTEVDHVVTRYVTHQIQGDGPDLRFAVQLPNIKPGHYQIEAAININWCSDNIADTNIHLMKGDYHNEKIEDFSLVTEDKYIEYDFAVVQYEPPDEEDSPPTPESTSAPAVTEAPVQQLATTAAINDTKADAASAAPVEVAPAAAAPVVAPSPAAPVVTNTTNNITATSSDGKFDYQFTLLTNPNYVDPGNRTDDNDKYMVQTGTMSGNNTSSAVSNTSDPQFIALPNGLPKSCQGIRDSGIGDLDGQYIIEARPGCHISVICVNMKDGGEQTKEFLGGPSEDEWKYWHYAVLIRISESDKRNIPQGACLEFSDQGKTLLHRIMVAGAREGSPISKWKTKISNIIRKKRNLPKKVSIITKPKLIRINKGESPHRWE